MKTILKTVVVIVILQFIGCQKETLFYWGDYSQTLYAYKKSPGDKTLADHKKSLLDIISVSGSKRKLVPPGVHVELGVILSKEGKEKDGLQYFNKEIMLYPESKDFIEKIITGFQSGEKK